MISFPASSRVYCLLLVVSAGCFSTYEPPPVTVPLFNKRNDVSLSVGGLRTGAYEANRFRSSETVIMGIPLSAFANAAWAPTDHTRVVAGGSYVDGRGIRESVDQRTLTAHGKHTDAMLGGGWGTAPFGPMRIEVLGGIGHGRFDVTECGPTLDGRHEGCWHWTDSRGAMTRGFAQAHVGLHTLPVEVALGLRHTVAVLQFDEIRARPSNDRATTAVLEPYLVARGGWKWVKLEAQVLLPVRLLRPESAGEPLVFAPGPRLVLGVSFSLEDAWKLTFIESVRDKRAPEK